MPTINVLTRRARIVFLVLMSLLLTIPSAGSQTPVATPAYDPADLHIIKPELRQEVAAAMPQGMTEYEIDLEFPTDTGDRTLTGGMTVRYTNTTSDALEELPFRLYANSAAEGNDAITLDSIEIDGEELEAELREQASVAIVPLPESLPAGEAVTLDVDFTTVVPVDEPAHYGMLNVATETGMWSIAHWYPMVAPRDPHGGWMLDPTSVYGDPVFTEASNYTVHITAPEELQLITSGVEIDARSAGDGWVTTTWSAAPSRDFVMLADTDMRSVEVEVAGTTITSWYHNGNNASGEASLVWTRQSLDLFNELLGEYPFIHLQVAEAEMFNAAGVEYPQLFTVGDMYYDDDPKLNGRSYFELTVAHEVVHQWFYSIVGNNQYADAFIDEGLASYLSSRVYFSEVYGDDAGADVFQRNVASPFRYMVEANMDVIVATHTDAFPSGGHYVNAAYVKAAMGFAAIHDEIGDDAFFGALQAYVEDFRFRVATPADLLAAFEAASHIEVEPLWTHWFERRNGTLDIRS